MRTDCLHTPDIFALRELFARDRIMLCFNGPITATLIEEIGVALRTYMEGQAEPSSAVADVFSVYIEITQNIRHYIRRRPHLAQETINIVVSRDEENHYVVSAGNVVEPEDGTALCLRIDALAALDKGALKTAFKTQLRRPRADPESGAGLGLIDMARRASQPLRCEVRARGDQRSIFQLRVVL